MQKFLDTDIGEITIFSRDENKQDLMRKQIKDERVNFIYFYANNYFCR